MPKVKFDILESTCVPLPSKTLILIRLFLQDSLSAISRQGFGDNLFATGDIQKRGEK